MRYSNVIDIFSNPIIIAGFFGWFIAQALKVPVFRYVHSTLDWGRFWGSGGMPSSHSSCMCAAAVAVGMIDGFDSSVFAATALMAAIVMTDAAGVRRAAGRHAKVLNEIIETLKGHKEITDQKLKEWIGHTPFEVLVGALTGIIIGFAVIIIYLKIYNL